MSKSEPRRRRKEARPGEILQAASAVFSQRGFSAARMEEIARRAGVGKGTVYLYFPSKQRVFEALAHELVMPRLEALRREIDGHPGGAADRIAAVLRRAGRLMADPEIAAFPKLILAEAGNFPELAGFWHREVVQRGLGLLAGIIERGVAAGEFRPVDPQAMAKLLMAPLLLLAVWPTTFAAFEERAMDPEAFVELHLATVLRGLAAAGA